MKLKICGVSMVLSKQLKQKPCRVKSCKKPFTPWTSLEVVCSTKCAIALIAQKKHDSYKKETTRLKAAHYDTDKKHWKKKARAACHKFIRARDALLPCISCGRFNVSQWQAGHFKTRGSNSQLQFHHWNINKECSQCNMFGSNDRKYKESLIIKIGQGNVNYLELNHQHYIWTIEDYKDVHTWYVDQYKALEYWALPLVRKPGYDWWDRPAI